MMERRTFLVTGSRAIVATVTMAVSGAPFSKSLESGPDLQPDHRIHAFLLCVAKHLFPHTTLSDQPYDIAVRALLLDAGKSRATEILLLNGVDHLDSISDNNWLAASPALQRRAIKELGQSAFLDVVYQTALPILYTHPELWELLGYEGSSVEHGGYLHRGFDDIDWLPED